MRILIATAGSRGDVAPYTGLGAALREAGHTVTLAATEPFRPLAQAAGLRFHSLPADEREHGDVQDKRRLLRAASAFVADLGDGLADAVAEGTDLLLLSVTTAPLGWHIAEAAGIESLDAYLQPTAPTGDFAPAVTAARSLGRYGNRLAGRFALRIADRLYTPAVTRLRARLELPSMPATAMRRHRHEAGKPVLHGFSTALLPRPTDWSPHLRVTGPWWPHVSPDHPLPEDLSDFLAAGPPPVLVSFGSLASGEGERLSGIAVAALRQAGLRGVLQSGSAGLAAKGDDILTVGDVPHSLLFPQLAAVIHHAGAGTSAAALRAGIPSVTVPVAADQPFWAARLATIGAAPAPIPFHTLTSERLTGAVATATRDSMYASAAAAAARHIAVEDGTAAVVTAVSQLGSIG
ncbi:glycosyltransferase [Streptomyces collinus]|uniref:glycosyltransferase n=1 Tax=Streptomyces collinus TaxID=42684 RepID=UPI00362FE257